MKHTNILYLLILVFYTIAGCSKIDNYAAPDAGFKVTVIDDITNVPIETEQPNGFQIKLWELKYAYCDPCDKYWMSPNGTYQNTKIFPGDFKMVPVPGPFFPVDTQRVTLRSGALSEFTFKVTPFLNIAMTASPTAGGLSIKYKISRTKAGGKITEARTMVSSIPTVKNSVFDVIAGVNKTVITNFTAVADATILATEYTDVISGLQPGKTYYIRASARTATNTSYNYSPIVTVIVQ